MKIILASQSPRRKELIEQMGIHNYEIIVSQVDEKLDYTKSIEEQVQELAYRKAEAIYYKTTGDRVVIGADTIVEKNGKIYGKPKDKKEAKKMLKEFQNSTVNVISGIAIIREEKGDYCTKRDYEKTKLWIKSMKDQEMEEWIATGKAMDKAGAFAIQTEFAVFIEKIVGDYNNVVGLPISKLYEMLKES